MSSSGHFTFSGIFSFPRHISRPTVYVSHLPHFQLSCHIPGATVCIYHFSSFSIFLVIFHYLKSVILIFRDFQYFSPYSRSYSVHFSFFTFFSDFVIFQVVKWMFLIFHDFQFSCHIPCPRVDISHFPAFSVFLAIFHILKCVFLIFHIFTYLAIF